MNHYSLLLLLAIVFPTFASAGNSDVVAAKNTREAYEIVKAADRFTVGGVGYAGRPSESEIAFRQLLKQPNPLILCQKLLGEATPSGQLYGLLGLRLLDRKAFQAVLPRYRTSKVDVPTMSGCIVIKTTTASIAEKIDKGKYK